MRNINSPKGQAAMEFMITYGWAIMIIMVAVGALTYIGFTNPANLLPDKCTFGNGIICQDSLITTGSVAVSFYNGLGKTIYDVTLTSDDFVGTCSGTIAALSPNSPVSLKCDFDSNPPSVGDTKKYKLKLTYKKTPTGFTQTSLGEVYGKVQS